METPGEKLARLAKDSPPSKWKENALYRKENRRWLDKSVDIALIILDVMDEKAITKYELAQRLKLSYQEMTKILKGQENLTLETISNLEIVLGIKIIEARADNRKTAA